MTIDIPCVVGNTIFCDKVQSCFRWIVCGAAFLAHLLSTGLQLAYGALHVYAIKHLGPTADHAGKHNLFMT